MTISQSPLKFGTSEKLDSLHFAMTFKATKTVQHIYAKRGFVISTILMDDYFAGMRDDDLDNIGIHLNTTSNDEHVPEIERYTRTVKERIRALYNSVGT